MIPRVACCLLAALCAACAPQAAVSQRRPVVAAFYPLAFAAEQIGGDRVEVVNLTKPGAEPHDLELTPGQVRRLNDAALVVLVGGGFQPAAEKAAAGRKGGLLEVLEIPAVEQALLPAAASEKVGPGEDGEEGASAGGIDPHVWLDPRLMAAIVESVGDRLALADQARADDHRRRAEKLAARLGDLDKAFATGLAQCDQRVFVTSHAAFGYIARRYGLTQVGISGLSPESEPSPRRLAAVASFVRERGVQTVFFETLVSPKVAESLAADVGVGTDVLDPIEGRPEGGDYFTGMERNLEALRKGLGCR